MVDMAQLIRDGAASLAGESIKAEAVDQDLVWFKPIKSALDELNAGGRLRAAETSLPVQIEVGDKYAEVQMSDKCRICIWFGSVPKLAYRLLSGIGWTDCSIGKNASQIFVGEYDRPLRDESDFAHYLLNNPTGTPRVFAYGVETEAALIKFAKLIAENGGVIS